MDQTLRNRILICVIIFGGILGALMLSKGRHQQQQPTVPPPAPPMEIVPPLPPKPATPNISTPIPSFLQYPGVIKQLQTWNKEAPELTAVGTYGKTSKGVELYYIKLHGQSREACPKVLITACIHGNEPHATTTVMAYIGTLLASYGKDEQITKLLDSREIYFVPVLSPDSFPHSRYVDGVDPNRDFDNRRSAPIRAIQSFFEQEKFKAAWSGHTWGRVFLYPWGGKLEKCPDDDVYRDIIGQMASMADYRMLRACELYNAGGGLNNPPIRYGSREYSPHKVMQAIRGAEMDWYYEHGAFGVVCEYGTHQRIPTDQETKQEFDRTFKAFLYFCEKAPVAELHPDKDVFDLLEYSGYTPPNVNE